MSIQLGQIAPDFEQDSSEGRIRFHEWLGDSWGVLFSHPQDFTPGCTTEDCAIILPSVSDAKTRFPQGWDAQTPSLHYVEAGDGR